MVSTNPAAPARVLVVDDEQAITSVVSKALRREGLVCEVASSGEEAVHVFERGGFDLVITDIRMPGMSGIELARTIKGREPLIPVIIMTAFAEVDSAVEAVRLAADDYLLKPFDLRDLSASVRRALEHRRLVLETRAYRRSLEERVQEQALRMEMLFLASIRSLIAALEAKDPYTRGHSERVTTLALAIGEVMGDQIDRRALKLGAQLHDIGKIGTREEVLNKPARLTPEEYEHVREHPLIGLRILAPVLDESEVLTIVRNHHERWDGCGYPDGLAAESIPMLARIVSVADAVDAITSPRAYRPARSWDEALRELTEASGTQFDPQVVEAAIDALAQPVAAAWAT